MPEILVVADDLTGALDSAVAFAGGGGVRVARRVEDVTRALIADPRVLAVSTGSREGSAAAAQDRIAALAEMLDLAKIPVVMKKVDSRLKGHVGAETTLLARLSARDRVLAAPAIPDMGRVQRKGQLTGAGIDGAIDIAARLAGASVPDIATDADLDAAVEGGGADTLWTGARGLAFALARSLSIPAAAPPALPGPMLFAVGSRDPITVAQVARLRERTAILDAPDGEVPQADAQVRAIVMTEGGGRRPGAEAGAAFADGIARALDRIRPMTLLASGGETADAVLDRLGIGCLDVVAEIAPGLPVCTARTAWGEMRIATKSGGFGPPDLLARIAAMTETSPDATDRGTG